MSAEQRLLVEERNRREGRVISRWKSLLVFVSVFILGEVAHAFSTKFGFWMFLVVYVVAYAAWVLLMDRYVKRGWR